MYVDEACMSANVQLIWAWINKNPNFVQLLLTVLSQLNFVAQKEYFIANWHATTISKKWSSNLL